MILCKTRHRKLIELLNRASAELSSPRLSDTRRKDLARLIQLELRYYRIRALQLSDN